MAGLHGLGLNVAFATSPLCRLRQDAVRQEFCFWVAGCAIEENPRKEKRDQVSIQCLSGLIRNEIFNKSLATLAYAQKGKYKGNKLGQVFLKRAEFLIPAVSLFPR